MQALRRSNLDYRECDFDPANLPKEQIERYAEQVAHQVGFHADQADPVAEVVKAYRGRLHYQNLDMWTDESGSIFVHGPFDFDIALPRYTSPLRDRFTIAHELGHYFLHANQGALPLIAHRAGSGRKEWEANWFAAALLMPREPVEAAGAKGMSPAALARRFGVSRRAAEVRMEALGLA